MLLQTHGRGTLHLGESWRFNISRKFTTSIFGLPPDTQHEDPPPTWKRFIYLYMFFFLRRDQNFIYKNIIRPFSVSLFPLVHPDSFLSQFFSSLYTWFYLPRFFRFFSFSFLILFYDVMTMIIWNFYGSQIQLLKVEDFIVPASRVGFIMILLDVFFEVVLSGSGVTGSSRRDRPNLVWCERKWAQNSII